MTFWWRKRWHVAAALAMALSSAAGFGAADVPAASAGGLSSHGWCGENRVGPARIGYTFEGDDSGRIPGHAFIDFANPLPSGARVVGPGDSSAWGWVDDGWYTRYGVNSWPWDYELVWYVRCR